MAESANGTTVPPATSIEAADGAVWTLGPEAGTSGPLVKRNGVPYFNGSGVLMYYRAQSASEPARIFVQNAAGTWFITTTGGWSATTPPASAPAPTPAPAPSPTPAPAPAPVPALPPEVAALLNDDLKAALALVDSTRRHDALCALNIQAARNHTNTAREVFVENDVLLAEDAAKQLRAYWRKELFARCLEICGDSITSSSTAATITKCVDNALLMAKDAEAKSAAWIAG